MNSQIEIHFKNTTTSINFDENFSFEKYYPKKDIIIITDKNLKDLYPDLLVGFNVIEVPIGDKCKTTEMVNIVINKLLENNVDRSIELVAFGGGAVCDLTGYIASIYMRGLRHSFVPTTLLSMIDASVGGKTAVNFNNVKNMIGTFYHPQTIYINKRFLDTLPQEEFHSGYAELIKIALVSDSKLFYSLAAKGSVIDKDIDLSIIYNAIFKKSEIVIKDEQDAGIRNTLNFGHTFGHIIESEYNLPHGISVLIGMKYAAYLSYHYKLLNYDDYLIIKSFLNILPTAEVSINIDLISKKLFSDKKRTGNNIKLILLSSIGTAVTQEFNIEMLETECIRILTQNFA